MARFPKTLVLHVDEQCADVLKGALNVSLDKLKKEQLSRDLLKAVVSHKHADCDKSCPFVQGLTNLESVIDNRERITRVFESLVMQCNSDADIVYTDAELDPDYVGASNSTEASVA